MRRLHGLRPRKRRAGLIVPFLDSTHRTNKASRAPPEPLRPWAGPRTGPTIMLGLSSIQKKVFGTANDRKIKSVRGLVDRINALEPDFQALSDEQIREKTEEFRKRV